MILVSFRSPVYVEAVPKSSGGVSSLQPIVAAEGTWANGSGSDGKLLVSSILSQNEDNLVPVTPFTLDTLMPANTPGINVIQENS